MTDLSTSLPTRPPRGERAWRGHRNYWLGQAAIWCLFAGLIASQTMMNNPSAGYGDALSSAVILAVGMGATTHVLRYEITRRDLLARRWTRLLGPMLLLGTLGGASLASLLFFSSWLLRGPSELVRENPLGQLLAFSVFCTVVIMGWLGLYAGFKSNRDYRRGLIERSQLDAALKDAELRALRGQLNPHFLFNSLNSLRRLVDSDPASARQAVTRLAALLRASLYRSEAPFVPLELELEQVEAYLGLESLRLEHRLVIDRDIQPELLATSVPPFALLTLVENGVKHGIATKRLGGRLGIRIAGTQERCVLTVTNPGPLGSSEESSGLGLRNLRERLALLYCETASLRLESTPGGDVMATLVLPKIVDTAAVGTSDP